MRRAVLWSLVLILTAAGRVPLADWPQWRGPQRDGVAADESIRTDWTARPPELLWIAEGMGQGFASVSVVDGTLYTTGNGAQGQGQQLAAVNAVTGKVIWTTPLTDGTPQHSYPGSRSTPTIDGGRVFAITSNGVLACLERDGGAVVWNRDFAREWKGQMMSHWGYSESPLIDGDAVICTPGGPEALLVKLDKTTGTELWRTDVPADAFGGQGTSSAAYSSIVISHGGGVKQYVQITGGGLVGVRADDGKLLWSYSRIANGTANVPTPIAVEDYVFGATGYGAGATLLRLSPDGNGGIQAVEVYFLNGAEFQNHHGGMVRYGDFIYAGHGNSSGHPVCLAWRTGDIVWGGQLRGAGSGSAAVTGINGHLLFRYEDGTLALIKATPEKYILSGTLKPAYQESQSWSHPVVVDGRLYLREQNKLMCYDVSL
ncbi:MAG: PQQ-binding-like beta-propeller repeat protein [Planctomycetaceae bacterium]